MLEIERRNTGSQSARDSLWKTQWTCHERDCGLKNRIESVNTLRVKYLGILLVFLNQEVHKD